MPAARWFIFFAMLCGFLISAEYAVVRPVSNSLFISGYTSQAFPYAWLAMVPLNLFLVSLYNRLLPKWGVKRTCFTAVGMIVIINVFTSLLVSHLSWLPFFHYIWKEIYVMLMFQQLWSVIHTTIPQTNAKFLYGILFAAGALGALVGSFLPGFFAVAFGSENLLLASPIIYLAFVGAYSGLLQHSLLEEKKGQTETKFFDGLKEGSKLLFGSKTLIFILIIVCCMQVSATLIDYQFNHVLEKTIGTKDLRTQFMGRVMGAVHASTLALQLVGSYLLVKFLGLRKSHLTIPTILCINSLAFLFFPLFGTITFAFIAIKSFDFSIFGVIKEMLYIPLKTDEKFRAKALIDVFAYRSSKAIASCLIVSISALSLTHPLVVLTSINVALFLAWIGASYLLTKHLPQDSVQIWPNRLHTKS